MVVWFSPYFPLKSRALKVLVFVLKKKRRVNAYFELKTKSLKRSYRFWVMSLPPFTFLKCLFAFLFSFPFYSFIFLLSVPQISPLSRFSERLHSKRKGIDRICSVNPRRSCVAWLTGPPLRFVTLQWSVDNNSMKVQDSFPYHKKDIFSLHISELAKL